jgi:RNA-directed DNA polymerase
VPTRGANKHTRRRYGTSRETETSGMDLEESERLIVPEKEGKLPQATLWREGGAGKTGLLEGKMLGTSSPGNISTRLQEIAELAREAPDMVITTLAHYIDIELLREAYRRTRKDGAAGVDGQTAEQYAENLEVNLQNLLDRFKSGNYKAPPVRRAYVPKKGGKNKRRPIGIPTLEDKVLQRAVSMMLEAVYEQDFLECSFGFRPRRSAHQALHAVREALMTMRGGWIIEADISSYFDEIDHQVLRSFLDQRVRDGVIRRTIDKWLKAGVLEGGQWSRPESGTPQGGVISPILSNIYLHEVLDVWFERTVKPRLQGPATLVRYCDDYVIAVANEADADRILSVLPKRLGKYGLRLHPDKTRIVGFHRPPHGLMQRQRPKACRDGGTRSFDFLGFTHYWTRSRKGYWVVKRKTSAEGLSRAIQAISNWCRDHRHAKISWQHTGLVRKIRGHYAYFGITGNSKSLIAYLHWVRRAWQKWLSRRSQKGHITWDRFCLLLERYPLPLPSIVHAHV